MTDLHASESAGSGRMPPILRYTPLLLVALVVLVPMLVTVLGGFKSLRVRTGCRVDRAHVDRNHRAYGVEFAIRHAEGECIDTVVICSRCVLKRRCGPIKGTVLRLAENRVTERIAVGIGSR